MAKGVKLTLGEMYWLAWDRGGKCLSTFYVNAHSPLEWQCSKGHVWKAVPNHITQGHWCPMCGGTQKRTLEDMQSIASSRGGKCLSDKYLNIDKLLIWQCGKGHTWKASPNNIIHNYTWCPVCRGHVKGTLEDMQAIAKARGGMCLSTYYVNSYTPLEWQCARGHRWYAQPDNVKRGSWCRSCSAHKNLRLVD